MTLQVWHADLSVVVVARLDLQVWHVFGSLGLSVLHSESQ
ncbi:hypothetical protein BASA_1663 [Bifidobacterium animalis subsp. animalis]|nr:hypothetical protein BASA_1663 [Bifidobacterium animalis subsp. animalis]